MTARALAMVVGWAWLGLGCPPATAPHPDADAADSVRTALRQALSSIHRRPSREALERRFGSAPTPTLGPVLLALARDDAEGWLVRSRAWEVLAADPDPGVRRAVRELLASPDTPASVRRSVSRIFEARTSTGTGSR